MQCPLRDHPKAHKHGKMPNGHQRYFCPVCQQTFSESFDSLSYRRQSILSKFAKRYKPTAKVVAYAGLVAITGLSYNTVVSIVRAASQKAQLLHTAEVRAVQTEEVSAHEMWSLVSKNSTSVAPKNKRWEIAGLG